MRAAADICSLHQARFQQLIFLRYYQLFFFSRLLWLRKIALEKSDCDARVEPEYKDPTGHWCVPYIGGTNCGGGGKSATQAGGSSGNKPTANSSKPASSTNQDAKAAVTRNLQNAKNSQKVISPIQVGYSAKITSHMFETVDSRPHKGIDVKAEMGTPLVATKDGEIDMVWGFDKTYSSTAECNKDRNCAGMAVYLKHDDGTYSQYFHGSGYPKGIKAKTRVTQGQVIMYSGNSGHSTGPHLHYENGPRLGFSQPIEGQIDPEERHEAENNQTLQETMDENAKKPKPPPPDSN